MCRSANENGRRCPSHQPAARRVQRIESTTVAVDEAASSSLYDATEEELDESRRLSRAAHRHLTRARKDKRRKAFAGPVAALASACDRLDESIANAVVKVTTAVDDTIDSAVDFVSGGKTPNAPVSPAQAPRGRPPKPAQPHEVDAQEAAEANETQEALEELENRPVRDREEGEPDWLGL